MSETFGMIKPNATALCLDDEIFDVIKKQDLRICLVGRMQLTKEMAEQFYTEHKGKPFFDELIAFMTSGPVIGFIVSGNNAVNRYRALVGDTDPSTAEKGTLRQRFGESKEKNSIHGSDSECSAVREIALFKSFFTH